MKRGGRCFSPRGAFFNSDLKGSATTGLSGTPTTLVAGGMILSMDEFDQHFSSAASATSSSGSTADGLGAPAHMLFGGADYASLLNDATYVDSLSRPGTGYSAAGSDAAEEGMDLDEDISGTTTIIHPNADERDSMLSSAAAATASRKLASGNGGTSGGKTLRRVKGRIGGTQTTGESQPLRHDPLDKTLRKKHKSATALHSMIGGASSSSNAFGSVDPANRLKNAASAPQLGAIARSQAGSRGGSPSASHDTLQTGPGMDSYGGGRGLPSSPVASSMMTSGAGSSGSNEGASGSGSARPGSVAANVSALFNRRMDSRTQRGEDEIHPLSPVSTANANAGIMSAVPVGRGGSNQGTAGNPAAATVGPVPMTAPVRMLRRTSKTPKKLKGGADPTASPRNQKVALPEASPMFAMGSMDANMMPPMQNSGKNPSPASTGGSLSTPQTPQWTNAVNLPTAAGYASQLQGLTPQQQQQQQQATRVRSNTALPSGADSIRDPALAALVSSAAAQLHSGQQLGRQLQNVNMGRRGTVSAPEANNIRPLVRMPNTPTQNNPFNAPYSAPVTTMPLPTPDDAMHGSNPSASPLWRRCTWARRSTRRCRCKCRCR